MIKITKGLDLPISGEPEQRIEAAPRVRTVALVADDYVGMKPTMAVHEGDRVRLGQLLFEDKRSPGVRYTAPGAGTVQSIQRGAKRKFESLVIELDGDDAETFPSFAEFNLGQLERGQVQEQLLASGLWTAFRTRPFSKVPAAGSAPHSIFVTAIDTNPLAANPEVVLANRESEFVHGLQAISRLTDGKLYLCVAPGAKIPGRDSKLVEVAEFGGPHPAGLPGTHIHFLDPVSLNKTVWHINYQDVAAIGHLFMTGKLSVERVISLAGPMVQTPRLVRTRLGANMSELVAGQLQSGPVRVVSGSVLCGRTSEPPLDYLGRYHLQVSALADAQERVLLGWQRPGFDKFSVTRVFAGSLLSRMKFPFTTTTNGSPRAMVPIGTYERVMPLDVLPTQLLRALIIGDTEQSQLLGALELDEDDLGLCTFVCPGKYEYGSLLRQNLTAIEREG